MRRRALVTLTTDIGWAYAAQMKAAILRRDPELRIVDIAHDLRPQGVREAAFLLGRIVPQFPDGTVHVAIVDPAVGGSRARLAVRCRANTYLVGPDNGVLSLAAEALGGGRAVRIDPARLPGAVPSSATFEGRDVFAPAAAALATGTPISRLGPRVEFRALELPSPRLRRSGAVGEVLLVDVFGNAITNVPTPALPEAVDRVAIRFGHTSRRSVPVVRTYADLPEDGVGILGSSFGLLELAVRDGSAARRLRLSAGDRVELAWPRRAGKHGK